MRAVIALALHMPMLEAASMAWGGEDVSIAWVGGANQNCTGKDYNVHVDGRGHDLSHECRFTCENLKGPQCDLEDDDCGCCGSDQGLLECQLLGGTTGYLVQAFCALTGFGSLVLKKRFLDDKKGVDRGWAVWGMDVTKQATSGVAAHVAGMINSHFLNRDTGRVGNECSWYFVAFTFDTTCGVMVGYVLLNILQQAAKKYNWSSLQATGNYFRSTDGMSQGGQTLVDKGFCNRGVDGCVWFKQMLSWCLITLIARAIIGAVLYLLKRTSVLQGVAQAVAAPFYCTPDLLLVLVMLGCPLGMNALQLVRARPPTLSASVCIVCPTASAPCLNPPVAPRSVYALHSQWVQDQFLRDASGAPSKFEKWMQRCRRGNDAHDPLLPVGESLRLSGSLSGGSE